MFFSALFINQVFYLLTTSVGTFDLKPHSWTGCWSVLDFEPFREHDKT